MPVTGMRASLAIQDALEREGIGRTSGYNGGHTAGWIETNRFGSTGFSLRPRQDGGIDWHIILSGKPHLNYREWKESQGEEGDVIDLHAPTNPEVLYPRIKAAFADIGVTVRDLRHSGHQTHWDDDVDYDVATDRPDWLGRYDPRNAPVPVNDPTLVAVSFSGGLHAPGRFPAYRLPGDAYLITRAGVEALADAKDWQGKPYQPVTVAENGALIIEQVRKGAPPVRINQQMRRVTNVWGDEVEAWMIPKSHLTVLPKFGVDVPVLVAGEMVTAVPFATIDAQYGDDAPWSVVPQPAPPL